jgi:hypothetical protein
MGLYKGILQESRKKTSIKPTTTIHRKLKEFRHPSPAQIAQHKTLNIKNE